MMNSHVPYCSSLWGHYTLRQRCTQPCVHPAHRGAMHTDYRLNSELQKGDSGLVWIQASLVYAAQALALHKCDGHIVVIACKQDGPNHWSCLWPN